MQIRQLETVNDRESKRRRDQAYPRPEELLDLRLLEVIKMGELQHHIRDHQAHFLPALLRGGEARLGGVR